MADEKKIIEEESVEDETTGIHWGLIVLGICLVLIVFFGFAWLNRQVSSTSEIPVTLFGSSDFSYRPGHALMNA
jgi:uncharacterized integral membrane protein